jgi:hypothetical protein
MSTRAKRRALLVMTGCSVAALVWLWFIVARPSSDIELFNRIDNGMSIEQVKELFPNRKWNIGSTTIPDRGEQWFADYNWWLNDVVISVAVDAEGRVIHKCLFDYEEEPFLPRACRWIGLNRQPRTRAVLREP